LVETNGLAGKVAIVTGAMQGIGAGISKVLASNGAHVVLTDIAHGVQRTAEDIRKGGLKSTAFEMDVAKTDEVNRVAQEVLSRFGRIDILVNNAGIYPHAELAGMSDEFMHKTFEINVFGMFRCTRAVLPTMIKQRYGKIVNMSSTTGPIVGDPAGGETAYGATKGAIWGFTVTLALEVAQYGINVNCICPSFVDTPGVRELFAEMGSADKGVQELGRAVPLHARCATSEEIGELALFLVSDQSKYLTGSRIVIDGGNTLQEIFRGPYASSQSA